MKKPTKKPRCSRCNTYKKIIDEQLLCPHRCELYAKPAARALKISSVIRERERLHGGRYWGPNKRTKNEKC